MKTICVLLPSDAFIFTQYIKNILLIYSYNKLIINQIHKNNAVSLQVSRLHGRDTCTDIKITLGDSFVLYSRHAAQLQQGLPRKELFKNNRFFALKLHSRFFLPVRQCYIPFFVSRCFYIIGTTTLVILINRRTSTIGF